MCCACGQLDLSEGAGGADADGGTSLSDKSAITVAQALQRKVGEEVTVKGYYVGFINGKSLNDAYFSVSASGENTNLLLADCEFDVDEEISLPVSLPSGSKVRAALNSFAHPELHRAPLLIRGTLETYFGVNGIKSVKEWKILSEYGEIPSDPEEERDPDSEEPEDTPPTPETIKLPQINPQGTPIRRAR